MMGISQEPTGSGLVCTITLEGRAGLLLARLPQVQVDEAVRIAMVAAQHTVASQ